MIVRRTRKEENKRGKPGINNDRYATSLQTTLITFLRPKINIRGNKLVYIYREREFVELRSMEYSTEEGYKKEKNWKEQPRNSGHHLYRVLSVLLNKLPRIGCPFSTKTCPIRWLVGRKVSVSSGREKRHRNSRLYDRNIRVRGHELSLTLRKLAHYATLPELFNYFVGGFARAGNHDPRGDATTRIPLLSPKTCRV